MEPFTSGPQQVKQRLRAQTRGPRPRDPDNQAPGICRNHRQGSGLSQARDSSQIHQVLRGRRRPWLSESRLQMELSPPLMELRGDQIQ